MLKRLRKGPKDKDKNPPPPPQPSSTHHKLTFLDLPAELRNTIYDLCATSTTLTLRAPKTKPAPPPPALSLASKQIRQEYHPILLSSAHVVADVYNYDFRDVARMAGSLYSSELRPLRLNPRLVLRLHCLRCRKDDLGSLRRWLAKRAASLDRLPWRYQLGWTRVVPEPSVRSKRDIIQAHLEALAGCRVSVGESLRWELDPIVEGFQADLRLLEEGEALAKQE